MGYIEKRGNERFIYHGQPGGDLFLRAQGVRQPVQRIVDFSYSGIRVDVQTPVAVETKVALEYEDATVRLEVFGKVVRIDNSTTEDGSGQAPPAAGARLGIALLNPLTLITLIQGAKAPLPT